MLKEIKTFYVNKQLEDCYFVDKLNRRQSLSKSYTREGYLIHLTVWKDDVMYNVYRHNYNFNHIWYIDTNKIKNRHGIEINFLYEDEDILYFKNDDEEDDKIYLEQEKKLKDQIEILLELNHTTAYTGTLEKLEQHSYVLYSDVLKLLNQKREALKKLK